MIGGEMPEPFHVMAKPSGPICNLDCEYCFYLEKERLYPDTSNFAMKDDVLESFVRLHIEAHGEHPVVSFAWQGGEPTLLGVEFFERVVALQSKYADGRRIDNALQTVGYVGPEDARVVQIANTLHLGEVLVSEACLAEVEARADLEIMDGPFEMPFGPDGNLAPVFAH